MTPSSKAGCLIHLHLARGETAARLHFLAHSTSSVQPPPSRVAPRPPDAILADFSTRSDGGRYEANPGCSLPACNHDSGHRRFVPADTTSGSRTREYRSSHEAQIISELTDFLSIPNVASDTPNIRLNAAKLIEMLKRRESKRDYWKATARQPCLVSSRLSALLAQSVSTALRRAACRSVEMVKPSIQTDIAR